VSNIRNDQISVFEGQNKYHGRGHVKCINITIKYYLPHINVDGNVNHREKVCEGVNCIHLASLNMILYL